MKLIMLINVKMVGIFTFISMIKYNIWEFESKNVYIFFSVYVVEISCSVELSIKKVL